LQAKQNKERIIEPKPCAKRWAAWNSSVCHSSKQNAGHRKNMRGVPIGRINRKLGPVHHHSPYFSCYCCRKGEDEIFSLQLEQKEEIHMQSSSVLTLDTQQISHPLQVQNQHRWPLVCCIM